MDDLQKALQPQREIELTVWDPENEDFSFTYHGRILAVTASMLLVSQSPEYRNLIAPGTPLGAILNTPTHRYLFYPKVLKIQVTDPRGYWLQLEGAVESEARQRRQHVRIPVAIPVHIERAEALPEESADLNAITLDLSGGGVRLALQSPLRLDETLRLTLTFEQERATPLVIATDAQVVFVGENPEARPGSRHIAACRFLALPEAQERAIVSACFAWETAHRKAQ